MSGPGFFSAALAGALSFLSPCVLPLIPAYLSFVSGAAAAELSAKRNRGRVLLRSLAFSAGFTLAFTVLGIAFSGGAMFIGGSGASSYIGLVGGFVVALLGLNMLFDFIGILGRDTRLIGRFSGKKIKGVAGAFLLGLAFAAGWSPCIGPILASILLYASREGSVARASALLLSYSLGFAIPFLAAGFFFDRAKPILAFFARHSRGVRLVSGIVLVVFGIVMAAGSLGSISGLASRLGYGVEEFAARNKGAAKAIGASLWLLVAASIVLPGFLKKRKFATPRLIAAGIAAAAAAAELFGIFSILSLLAAWLTFSGI